MSRFAIAIRLLFVLAACPAAMVFAYAPIAARSGGDAPVHAVVESLSAPPSVSLIRDDVHPIQAQIDRVIDRIASEFDRPERVRRHLVNHLRWANTCFAAEATDEQLEAAMKDYLLRPPGSFDDEMGDRFFTESSSGRVWVDDGLQGLPGQGKRARLTYSFPADQPVGGTAVWGMAASGFSPAPNNLNSALAFVFGSDPDRGREFIRQALAAWRKYGGVEYEEVADDNTSMSSSTTRVATRGDIRIGGISLGVNGVLGYNAFPSTLGGATLGGGDMCLNTSYFTDVTPGTFYRNANNDYRYLRNTVSHEHGHGLGYFHAVPCNQTKIMEPTITATPIALTIDERRAVAHNYGDRFSGNQTSALAHDFGTLTSPSDRSVIERDLALNRVASPNQNQDDWFKFTLTGTRSVTITVTPTGGVYANDQQSSMGGCTGANGSPTPTVDATAAGNIQLSLHNSVGTLIEQAVDTAIGQAETITRSLSAGTYLVLVRNAGYTNPFETNPNLTTQLYDLLIRVGTSMAPPWAVAGINKRVAANTTAYFNGVPNSQVTEVGASIFPTAYDWDLDGDGVFETIGQPRPTFQYPSNGVYDVRLRVTDSNGMQGFDTIKVRVFGATTQFQALVPNSGARSATVPITVYGTNLKNVKTISQFAMSGSGVTFTGTPVVDALGTEVTGVSVVISSGAALGQRTLTIFNTDGNDSSLQAINAFTILAASPPSNDECSAPISWGNTAGAKSVNTVNATTSANQSFPASGCPAAGSIHNDVWYSWTAPITGRLTASYSGNFSIRLAMYQGTSCPPGTLLGCDDFALPVVTNVTAGQTYMFRVGGTSAGLSGTGTVNLLVEVVGACCVGSACSIVIEDECAAGSWTQGVTSCVGVNCCPADINSDGVVDLADLLSFLALWNPSLGQSVSPGTNGDFNGNGIVDLADLLDFLGLWNPSLGQSCL
ncbi:MAG: hypothetical protein KF768_03315 [Phycisphaeraceae bacterium]|nr:hypothetical protein [Phycisphaeraceae bacterium]